jgi:hypothetical protein
MPTRPIRPLLTGCLLTTCAVLSPLGAGVSLAHPTADFEWAPKPVVAGTKVTFTSTSTPFHEPWTPITLTQWTIPGAGTLTGEKVTVTAPSPGPWEVNLHVRDEINETGEVTKLINVEPPPPPPSAPPAPSPPANRPPTPALAVLPASPVVGEEVTFISYSEDQDGRISEHAWDLDGDGRFNDANAAVATRRFSTPGSKQVTLRVRDDKGSSVAVSRTLVVRQPPAPPTPGPTLLSPFPVVRLAGSLTPGGVIVRVLSVRAPVGARVVVRCSGRGCPAKRARKRGRKAPVRFAVFERRLPVGVVLEVLVRSDDRIGKYARFRIRRNRVPKRSDACLRPGTARRIACP